MAGPGGLWFCENQGHKIARITTSGVITEYSVPGAFGGNDPDDLIAGPDGSIWFGEKDSNRIGRLNPDRGFHAVPGSYAG